MSSDKPTPTGPVHLEDLSADDFGDTMQLVLHDDEPPPQLAEASLGAMIKDFAYRALPGLVMLTIAQLWWAISPAGLWFDFFLFKSVWKLLAGVCVIVLLSDFWKYTHNRADKRWRPGWFILACWILGWFVILFGEPEVLPPGPQ